MKAALYPGVNISRNRQYKLNKIKTRNIPEKLNSIGIFLYFNTEYNPNVIRQYKNRLPVNIFAPARKFRNCIALIIISEIPKLHGKINSLSCKWDLRNRE